MTDEQTEAMPQLTPSQEVARIRDIIFGSQMQDYEQRFDVVQRDLDRLQQEIDRLSEQLADQDGNQSKKLQNLRQEMRKADKDLREELRQTAQKLMTDKVDRVAMGDLFIELGTHLKTGGSLVDLLKDLGELAQAQPDDGE
jgi:DNA repair exonuclease SbcCD ATPase subunit